MNPARFHPGATQELLEAHSWYEGKSHGLGNEFMEEIARALEAVCSRPQTWPTYVQDIRKYLTYRFPYAIYYRIRGDGVQVLAVAHASRRQDYWIGRLKDDV